MVQPFISSHCPKFGLSGSQFPPFFTKTGGRLESRQDSYRVLWSPQLAPELDHAERLMGKTNVGLMKRNVCSPLLSIGSRLKKQGLEEIGAREPGLKGLFGSLLNQFQTEKIQNLALETPSTRLMGSYVLFLQLLACPKILCNSGKRIALREIKQLEEWLPLKSTRQAIQWMEQWHHRIHPGEQKTNVYRRWEKAPV